MERLEVAKAVPPFLPRTGLHLDRRRHKRYQVKTGALISPVARDRKYWKMLDVSMGGASFRYIPYEDLKTFTEIDLVMRDLAFALEGIPYKVISDCEFAGGLSSLKLRRCGVEFGPLTDFQKPLLLEFIRKYTAAVPLD